AADGNLALDSSAVFAREVITVEVGDDPAGRDRVDADAPEAKLERERLGELDHAGLRHRVCRGALGNAEAQHRGNIDDRAALRRAAKATAAPCAASTSANRTPRPLEAPVTSATRPVRSNSSAVPMSSLCPQPP